MQRSVLILMRHGESMWNQANRFTGWVDIPLSPRGILESLEGGKKIAQMPIDLIFTSSLIRAQMTAMLAMTHHASGRAPRVIHPGMGQLTEWETLGDQSVLEATIPVICAPELNERMYGDLQGKNKQETIEQYGKEQVQVWRRSFAVPPPRGESLEMTIARALPYFQSSVMPSLAHGKNVFVCAHGNSLRGIVMWLERISKEEIPRLELTTGEPLVYEYDGTCFTKRESCR